MVQSVTLPSVGVIATDSSAPPDEDSTKLGSAGRRQRVVRAYTRNAKEGESEEVYLCDSAEEGGMPAN